VIARHFPVIATLALAALVLLAWWQGFGT